MYEIGDKVKIKDSLISDKFYGEDVFVWGMEKCLGRTATIVEVIRHSPIKRYKLDIDEYEFNWTGEMFEGKVKEVELEDNNKYLKVDRSVLMFAMRYAIGRQTFAPTIVMENIKYNIHLLSSNEIGMMVRDINDHIGSYGMEPDRKQWMNFKEYLEEKQSH